MAADLRRFERIARGLGFTRVAGTDEVGRGPLAGPVVAAAVILPPRFSCPGLNDSKLMTAAARERASRHILGSACQVGLGVCDVAEIDHLNIHRAGLQAMIRALESLPEPPDYVLVDGFRLPVGVPQAAIVKGDRLSLSVMAAAVVAKVARDHMMEDLDQCHPGYGFAIHKGYATRAHRDALIRLGPSPQHRRSFASVRASMQATLQLEVAAG